MKKYFKIKGYKPTDGEKTVEHSPQIKQHQNLTRTLVQIGGVQKYNQMAKPEKAPVPKGCLSLMGSGSVNVKDIFKLKPKTTERNGD
jgi:hypothetical protein